MSLARNDAVFGGVKSGGSVTPLMAPTNEGPQGNDGWTPILAGEADGTRTLIKVADWTGGEGEKPATGMYIGTTGYVATKAAAFNFNAAKRVMAFSAVSAAVTGIATINYASAGFTVAPVVVVCSVVPTVPLGGVKAEKGAPTTTGVTVTVTQANLLGVVGALIGATVTVLVIEQ